MSESTAKDADAVDVKSTTQSVKYEAEGVVVVATRQEQPGGSRATWLFPVQQMSQYGAFPVATSQSITATTEAERDDIGERLVTLLVQNRREVARVQSSLTDALGEFVEQPQAPEATPAATPPPTA